MAEIDLTWSPSTDNIAVAGYRIRRNTVIVAVVDGSTTSYHDTGLSPSTSYTYTVEAFDAAGNYSAASAPATAVSGTDPAPTVGRLAFAGVNSSNPLAASSHGIKSARKDIYALSRSETDAAISAGMSILPILDYAMGTTSGDHVGPTTSAQRTAWATTACDRLATIFANPNALDAVEIWNEPFLSSFWQPTANPSNYLALVIAFNTEIQSRGWTHPKLLISADPGYGGWCDSLLAADTGHVLANSRFLPTVHPYCNDRAPDHHSGTTSDQKNYDFDRYKFTYSAWQAHGHPDPQCWLTEFGWVSITSGQHYGAEGPAVSETTQGTYMAKAYDVAFASGQCEKAFSYLLSPGDSWAYNWLRNDGSEKPVFPDVRSWIAS